MKITKQEAINRAREYGINFCRDFFAECSDSKSGYLADLARDCGYRKPRNANGSTGRYFYSHLNKLIHSGECK